MDSCQSEKDGDTETKRQVWTNDNACTSNWIDFNDRQGAGASRGGRFWHEHPWTGRDRYFYPFDPFFLLLFFSWRKGGLLWYLIFSGVLGCGAPLSTHGPAVLLSFLPASLFSWCGYMVGMMVMALVMQWCYQASLVHSRTWSLTFHFKGFLFR